MHLKRSKRKDGREYLSIVRTYREGKRTLTNTHLSLGYLDPGSPDYGERISEYQALAEAMEAAWQEENATLALGFPRKKKVDKKAANRRNVGYAALSDKYHRLGIDRFLAARAKGRGFEYNVNAIFRLLVYERCLNPGSKSSDFDNRQWYFDAADFTLKDVYRSLDFLAAQKDAMIARMNRQIGEARRRNTAEVYYDTTNYYFEIDEDDADTADADTGKIITEGLRKRGASKEHRKSPIVSMGLMMDSDGLPICYKLFPGNKNDSETALPVLKQIKEEYALGRIVMVADKGINCSDNIAACALSGNGYVFSQSVRRSDRGLREWVLSEEGYAASEGFKCKSRQGHKTVYVTGEDGEAKEVGLDVKYVAFWSADYDARAKAQRARILEKSKKMASSKAGYDHARSHGAARYVKETVFDAATGEVKKTLLELDLEAVAEDERYDGYYLIVTSETEKPEGEIIDVYRGLWRIEESFKVTKSELGDRPVHVWTPEHIEAHFLVCYVALVIVRLIQLDFGYRYSAGRILGELRALQCSHLKDNVWHFDYRTDLSDELCENAGVTFNREVMTLKEIKGELAKARKG